MKVFGVLGIVSALVLNIAIWSVIAVFVTVGLAAADVSASTFYLTWVFFAAVMVGGAFLTIKWGKEGRRWLWRITLSWTILFLITLVTLGLALVLLGLACLIPGVGRFVSSCLVPPPPVTSSIPSGENAE